MSKWSAFRAHVAGKWQFPLLLASLLCLAASLYGSRSRPTRLPLPEAIAQLEALVESGVYDHALELGDVLLAREDCAGLDAAAIRRLNARSRFAQAARGGSGSVSAGRYVVEQYRAAESGGIELTADDARDMGQAWEWQGQFAAAFESYESALRQGVREPWEVRRRVVELMRNRLEAPPQELHARLDALLGEVPDSRPDLRVWALEEQLSLLEDLDRPGDAASLLDEHAERLRDTPFATRFEYLEALRLFKAGEFKQAELSLRALRHHVGVEEEVHAMSGWLLGRAILSEGGADRGLEAMSFFQDVLRNHLSGPYVVASRVGLGESLAILERHEEAAEEYRLALGQLAALGKERVVNRDTLAVSLAVAAEAQRRNGHLESALDYARFAARLMDAGQAAHTSAVLQQFADIAVQLAEDRRQAGSSPPPGELFAEAAEAYLRIAKLNVLHERRAAEATWAAGENYAKSGDTAQAVKIFEQYIFERPGDALAPRAWLRIGEIRHDSRQLRAAIATYQECYRRFPRTLDGSRALVPLARCYISLGADQLELAEKTLRIVLEDSDVFTPQAPEFADALFLLGDVLSRREGFAAAIGLLAEFLERYPGDPRVPRARFLLADAYRKSGLAMRDGRSRGTTETQAERLGDESEVRLRGAGELFRGVIEDYGLPSDVSDPLQEMYLRHARLYEADCYFDSQDYPKALALYEEAAGLYRDSQSGLAAYMQIVNCHVFLGKPDEARAALARAMVLLERMPSQAFETSLSPQTREDWKRYFAWLGQAGLF